MAMPIAISPKYAEHYRRNEISEWFARQGFGNPAFSPDQIGICGIKQVTSAAGGNVARITGWQDEPVHAL